MLVWCAWKPRWGAVCVPVGMGDGLGCKGSSHRLVVGSRGPSRMTLLSWRMRQRPCENWMTHPLSQNLAMERSECDARPGKMWAFVLPGGSVGKFNRQLCLNWMPSPLGMGMVIGCRSGWRSRCGLDFLR